MRALHATVPSLGFGLGLRAPHHAHILAHRPPIDWFEIISENFMPDNGESMRTLERIAAHYPLVMHGVGLSIGGTDALDVEYLRALKQLAKRIHPAWISDHVCWTGIDNKHTHDLLPLPYTEEALAHVVSRIHQVQDYLGCAIALENPASYLEFQASQMPEAEFIARMVEASGCHLLLDITNVYVTCYNHRLDVARYLDTLPLARVAQIHLSGHAHRGSHLIDTHDSRVIDDVWAMYGYVIARAGRNINTMVEWDAHIPQFAVLEAELANARRAADNAKSHAPLPKLEKARVTGMASTHEPLRALQTRMQAAILPGGMDDSVPDAWVLPKAEFSAREQLSVYVLGYRLRLHEATHSDYRALKAYLGEKNFDQLLRDYVNAVTSEHYDLAYYSRQLPGFLARHPMADARAIALCELECAIVELTRMPDSDAMAVSQLAQLSPEALMGCVLRPRAALRLLAFPCAVNATYRALCEGMHAGEYIETPEYIAVFRHDATVWRLVLAPDEYYLLSALFAAMPVEEALACWQEAFALGGIEAMQRFSDWLGRWLRNGLIARAEPSLGTLHERIVA